MMRYFTISHVPGKDLIIADTLSRAPITVASESEQIQKEAGCFVDVVVESLLVTQTAGKDQATSEGRRDMPIDIATKLARKTPTSSSSVPIPFDSI